MFASTTPAFLLGERRGLQRWARESSTSARLKQVVDVVLKAGDEMSSPQACLSPRLPKIVLPPICMRMVWKSYG